MTASKKYLITRPKHQAEVLAMGIRELGDEPVLFPCIAIEPLNIGAIDSYFDIAIVTSINAITPETLQIKATSWLAVGPATAEGLQSHEIPSTLPGQYSSEGLLELSQLQTPNDLKIIIITGENPKPLLQQTLKKRGADVTVCHAYRRLCPHYNADQINAIVDEHYEWIITTSPECLENLIDILKDHETWIRQQNLLVVSDNMMASAKAHLFKHVAKAPNAHHHDILHYLAMMEK